MPEAPARALRPEVVKVAAAIWRVVDGATEIGAVAHKEADGDTLGSALGFAAALAPLGKRVAVVTSPPIPATLRFLPGIEHVNQNPLPAGGPIFVFDAGDPGRAGVYAEVVAHSQVVVNIDHHITNTIFGSHNLVVTTAASTGELVYELLQAWNVPIPKEAATCLYATILTDTGGFRHDNTSERALRAAAELAALGADPAGLARAVFKSRPPSTLRMQARILQGLHFECGDRLIWSSITQQALADSGASNEQADGAIDQLNSVRGQEIAILFKEISRHQTRISIRTRDRVDAADLAKRFGGGGHLRASGIDLALPLHEAEQRVLAEARRVIECAAAE